MAWEDHEASLNGRDKYTYADTCDESAGVDLAQTTVVCQENDNTENPDDAELTCSPESTDSIGDEKSEKGAGNRADLYHGRDISLDVGICLIIEVVQVEDFLEMLGVECSVHVSNSHAV